MSKTLATSTMVIAAMLILFAGASMAFADNNEREAGMMMFGQSDEQSDVHAGTAADQTFIKRIKAIQEAQKEKREQFKAEVEGSREEIKTELHDLRETFKDNEEMLHEELKARLEDAEDSDERHAILEEAKRLREEHRAEIRSEMEDIHARRIELQAQIKAEVASRIKEHLENALNRLDRALERFSNILDRISARIDALDAAGADTAAATAAALEAETAVADASSLVAEAKSVFEAALESEVPRNHLDEIREAIRAAVDGIKEAHSAIQNTIQELKIATRALNDLGTDDSEENNATSSDSQDTVDD